MIDNEKVEFIAAVQKAVSILNVFTIDDASLTLTEICRRVRLPKTTTFRMMRTLAASGYLVQLQNGSWRLGPATASLGARYQVAFDMHRTIDPVMRELNEKTGRSVSYYVHDGDARIRMLYLPPRGSKTKASIGEPLPLTRGSAGQVLLAFNGEKGVLYDEIRNRGYHYTIGENRGDSASIAAPILGARWAIVGALGIGVPIGEATKQLFESYAPLLVKAGEELSRELARQASSSTPLALARTRWHPE